MLSKRWIINYILVFLVILFTYIGNKYNVQPGYQTDHRISSLKHGEIDRILIETASDSLSLAKVDGIWWLQTPVQWPGNNVNINRLIDIVNQQTESKLPASDADLKALGLMFPRANLQLNDQQIVFGTTNNIGDRRYLLIDKTVYLTPDIHFVFIAQGLPGLIDRRLLPDSMSLKSLQLPGFNIERDSTGIWKTDSRLSSSTTASDLIDNWQKREALSVKRFQSKSSPRQKIVAYLEDGRRQEFFLMAIEPEIVIANPAIGMQYHFQADDYYQMIAFRQNETSD
ncbi:MAG: DUF4340 domain-containing protein [Pseudomonadota bacterium]